MLPALILIPLVALFRIFMAWQPAGSGWPGFTPLAAVALCAGVYLPRRLALVVPLVRAGLVPRDWPLSVNAVSGFSGGGKALILRVEDDARLAWRSYGYGLDHKHVPEMQVHAGLTHAPVFAPGVTRAFRGMIVEVPLTLAALPAHPSRAALVDTLGATFAGQPLVTVHGSAPDELLIARDAAPNDRLDLYVATDRGETRARLIATLDNLGKGAGGAAMQSLNLMAGLDPLAGLIF